MSINSLVEIDPVIRPKGIRVRVNLIPDELKVFDQWVNWTYEQKKGRWAKPPINPTTGREAKVNDSTTWSPFDAAVHRYYEIGGVDGVGFVVTRDTGVVVIDLDGCRNPYTGTIDRWAMDIIRSVNSYTSISPSGTGVHIFAYSTMPKPGVNKPLLKDGKQVRVEVYVDGHYVTETGAPVDGTPRKLANAQRALDRLIEELESNESASTSHKPANAPAKVVPFTLHGDDSQNRCESDVEIGSSYLDDKSVIARIVADEKCSKLWNGDWSGYPSPSEADLYAVSWLDGQTETLDRWTSFSNSQGCIDRRSGTRFIIATGEHMVRVRLMRLLRVAGILIKAGIVNIPISMSSLTLPLTKRYWTIRMR